MRYECRSIYGESARGLDSIWKFQVERGSKPCCTLGDADIQFNALPGLENGAVTSRERFITGLQWACQDLRYRDRRHGKSEFPRSVAIEKRLEARCEPRI